MQFRVKPIIAALCLLNGFAMCAYGAEDVEKTKTSKDALTQLTSRSELLEEQVIALQKTLADLHNTQKKLLEEQRQLKKQLNISEKEEPYLANSASEPKDKLPQPGYVPYPGQPPQAVEQRGPETLEDDNLPEYEAEKIPAVPYGYSLLGNIGGTAVITSPFIQSRYEYGGAGLITNYSSINKDISILLQRQNFAEQMAAMNLHMPSYPLLELSGKLEAQFFAQRTYSGRKTTDFDVSAAELDLQALISPIFTGFMSFSYNNAPPPVGARVSNSALFIDNAFITLGNFNRSPFYATFGQDYVPFGQFDSFAISDPINKTLFRTKARALTLGYQQADNIGLYSSIFAFRGDTRDGVFKPGATSRTRSGHINTFGANLGYEFRSDKWKGEIGTSYISNVADSVGMQSTGGNVFGGFGSSSVTEVLGHAVPGVDLRGMLGYDKFMVIAYYTTATREFSPYNLTFNGDPAQPSAYHAEGVYSFDIYGRPSSFVLGYDYSREALGLNVPERRYTATLNTSIWRNTLASIELRHDTNYGDSDTASGGAGPVFTPRGDSSNALTAHFDVYF